MSSHLKTDANWCQDRHSAGRERIERLLVAYRQCNLDAIEYVRSQLIVNHSLQFDDSLQNVHQQEKELNLQFDQTIVEVVQQERRWYLPIDLHPAFHFPMTL